MLILQTYTFLANLMDLGAFHRNNWRIGFRVTYILLTDIAWFLFAVFTLILGDDDSIKLGTPLIKFHGDITIIAIYAKFLFHHDHFISLLDDLQDIVNDSMYYTMSYHMENRIKTLFPFQGTRMKRDQLFYRMTEDKIEHITKIVLKIIALLNSVSVLPLIGVTYDFCMGTYTPSSWKFLYDLW